MILVRAIIFVKFLFYIFKNKYNLTFLSKEACYLSPRVVADILEYRNPRNLTLRELMNLAEGNVDFSKQEKAWDNNLL